MVQAKTFKSESIKTLPRFILENNAMLTRSFVNASINCIRAVPEIAELEIDTFSGDPNYEVYFELANIFKQKHTTAEKLRNLKSFDPKLNSAMDLFVTKYGNPIDAIKYFLNKSGALEWDKLFKFTETLEYSCQNCQRVKSIMRKFLK